MNKKLVALAVAGVLAAPLAQAQTANVTLYGRVNLDVEGVKGTIYNNNVQQPATCNKTLNLGGCITQNPAQYRVSYELVALRSARHGIARWWPQRNLPDRVVDQPGAVGRHAGRSRIVRRSARRLGYVQDGPLPDPVRRHPPDLR